MPQTLRGYSLKTNLFGSSVCIYCDDNTTHTSCCFRNSHTRFCTASVSNSYPASEPGLDFLSPTVLFRAGPVVSPTTRRACFPRETCLQPLVSFCVRSKALAVLCDRGTSTSLPHEAVLLWNSSWGHLRFFPSAMKGKVLNWVPFSFLHPAAFFT